MVRTIAVTVSEVSVTVGPVGMNPCVSFLSTDALAFTGAGAVSCSVHGHQDPPRTRRRALLRVAGLALAGAVVPLRARAARAWTDAELCGSCGGCGQQPCSLCSGSGIFTVDDSVVTQSLECPNCQGAGRVRCLRCIGLGLSDTRGVLRNGS